MRNKKYLVQVRRSRKAYLPAYLMAVIVIFSLSYVYYSGASISYSVLIISGAFIISAIKFPEFYRIQDWWAITENVKEISFEAISDIRLSQSLLKRFMNCGDVDVRAYSIETSIKIDNIDKPGEFIEKLQKIISIDKE